MLVKGSSRCVAYDDLARRSDHPRKARRNVATAGANVENLSTLLWHGRFEQLKLHRMHVRCGDGRVVSNWLRPIDVGDLDILSH